MVAKTIYQQLGGHQFATMTGAKCFIKSDNSLRFDIGRNKSKANRVKITLEADDTYTVEFWKRGREFNVYTILANCYKEGMSDSELELLYQDKIKKAEKAAQPALIAKHEGIYSDMLQDIFTMVTGLYTHL